MTDNRLTLSQLKTFCALRSCTLRVGNRELGFVAIDADGIINPRSYSSFNPAGEMIGRPNPATLLRIADAFVVRENSETKILGREEFLTLLDSVIRTASDALI
ncbi:MAG: hypothetical protein HYX74_00950 [Acidobacteria bacterium]|nr:hypothetical protein [Acidobacteriota bacterium]